MAILGDDGGIKLTIPNKGDTDWTEMIKAAFKAIAEHNHTGTDYGYKIDTTSLATNCVTENILQDSDTSDAARAVDTNHIKSNAIVTSKITDANVTLAKVENVSAARLIVGNSSNRPTSVDVTGDITISNTGVTTIGTDKVVTTMIADENITVAKKKTYDLTLTDDSTYYALADLTSLAGANNKSFKINYKISDSSNNIQVGSISGVTGVSKVDEYVGVDMGASLRWNGSTTHQLEVKPGTSGDVLTYSIEFLE